MLSDWSQEGRSERERDTIQAFEAGGMKLVKLQSPHELEADPQTGIPVIAADTTANPMSG